MKTYGQFCPVARSLDVIGDRWSLLIVRELLLRGACRYTDLRNGLPGVATNLLAERLKDLEEAGVISSRYAAPPIATTLFSLTKRGAELEPVIMTLARWGLPLLFESTGDAGLQGHWLEIPARMHLVDQSPQDPPVIVEVRVDLNDNEEPLFIEAAGGSIAFNREAERMPDAVVSGAPFVLVGLVTGRISLDEAAERGLLYEGDRRAIERLLPPEYGPVA